MNAALYLIAIGAGGYAITSENSDGSRAAATGIALAVYVHFQGRRRDEQVEALYRELRHVRGLLEPRVMDSD